MVSLSKTTLTSYYLFCQQFPELLRITHTYFLHLTIKHGYVWAEWPKTSHFCKCVFCLFSRCQIHRSYCLPFVAFLMSIVTPVKHILKSVSLSPLWAGSAHMEEKCPKLIIDINSYWIPCWDCTVMYQPEDWKDGPFFSISEKTFLVGTWTFVPLANLA